MITKDIPVTYRVNDFTLSRSSVPFATNGNVIPPAQTITVTNAGPDALSGLALGSVTYSGSHVDLANYKWLNPTLTGVSGSGATLNLGIQLADSIGDFTAQFTLSATGIPSKLVTVTYTRRATVADVQTILNTCQSGCHTVSNVGNGFVSFATPGEIRSSPTWYRRSTRSAIATFFTTGDSTEAGSYLVRLIDGVEPVSANHQNMPFGCANKNASCLSADARIRIYLWAFYGGLP